MRFTSSLIIPVLLLSSQTFAQSLPDATLQGEAVGDDAIGARVEQVAQESSDDIAFPRFTYGVGLEVEDDWTVDSDDEDTEINNLTATVETAVALEFKEASGIYSTLVFEQVLDQNDDSEFDDHGLYVEELYAAWQFGPINVKGGKFNPAFGLAWDAAPGIYGTDFAEDYELTERIGVGASYGYDALGSEHELSASAFFADTSRFSQSVITKRGNLDEDDGGPSNTESLESFAVQLAGSFGDTGYAIGVERQAGGEGDVGDELGISFGLTHAIELGDEQSVELLGEVAHFNEAGAGDEDATYLTFGAAYATGPFTLSGIYSYRDIDTDDHLATATLEYEVFENASLGIGYRYGDEGDASSHTVGVLATYEFGGGVSFAN